MTSEDNEWTIDNVVSGIRAYADDNNLTPVQLKAVFEAGMVAKAVLDSAQAPE